MSFISETASAIKRKLGFDDPLSEMPSASKEILESSPILSFTERFDDATEGMSNPSFHLNVDPSFWKDRNVQVIIRMRPLGGSELSTQWNNKCVRQDSCQQLTWTGHPESRFTFDAVADENVTQEMIFKVAGLPMVDNCMGGYNSCMFAYGQTGSGKTYTMLGDFEGGRHSVNCGITPRIFECLFSRISKEKDIRKEEKLSFTCKCSFLEIYNEQIFDLLDPSSSNLHIREDSKKGVYVENLREHDVESARDVIAYLVQGAANRRVAATNMNRASSRSHSVFTCTIESKWEAQEVTRYRFARLNLVDLAGSERQKSSGAEGDRLKEATNINKSLSTLGLVIMNLVNESSGKSVHVPYRDSKLTFLLQDSLGGNSKTTIIANISPSNCCALETLSTLKFAQRAKFIKNNAIVNEDALGDVLAMRMQIQQLRREKMDLQNLCNILSKENNSCASFFPVTPGMAHNKDYDVVLVGAFKREKDKDVTLHALTAENQAAMHLIKQREDEIQGLKMRLRLREAGTKRLEAVVAGKLSPETFLLNERAEHLKEIEMLRAQAERNQEVTRFAMENLQLKEEIKRLKSFYDEGERELLNEQISALQSKLMEALDWKLLHEQELLNIQAPQKYQPEIEKETLNLKPMVDAIATASQREAETHEVAILLHKENEELKLKLNILLDDNSKLIEMYERAIAEPRIPIKTRDEEDDRMTREKVTQNLEIQLSSLHEENDKLMGLYENAMLERDEFKRTVHINEFKKWVSSMEENLSAKRQKLDSLKLLSKKICERRSTVSQKLLDLKCSPPIPPSSISYFEEEEIRARAKLGDAVTYVHQKKEELNCLQAQETKYEETRKIIQQSEGEQRNNLALLKSKAGEESGKIEHNRKALWTIENTRTLPTPLSATDLLESEVKMPKLSREIDRCRERIKVLKNQAEGIDMKCQKLHKTIKMVGFEIEGGLKCVEEAERGVENILKEKAVMELEFEGIVKTEVECALMECVECTIEGVLKDEEAMMVGEELEKELKMVGELSKLIDDRMWYEDSSFLYKKLERELITAGVGGEEARLFLNHLF